MEVAIQEATMAVGVMSKACPSTEPHARRSIPKELHSQPAFDGKAQDRFVELLNFEVEVAMVLQAKACDLNDEDKVPIIKTG